MRRTSSGCLWQEFDLLRLCIKWIDLSFVEREPTPEWVIQLGIRCYLAGILLRDASQLLDELGVKRSHVDIHERVHKAGLQPNTKTKRWMA